MKISLQLAADGFQLFDDYCCADDGESYDEIRY